MLPIESPPLTVSELNKQVRAWLEYEIGEVKVTGEISNLSKPNSGHYYFTLKDQNAQLRCVFFRNHHNKESKSCEDGQEVIVKGKLSLYENRGEYQLIVQEIVQAGLGALYQQFALLKNKLEQQGLFAADRKRALPPFPSTIGVITSESGAAIQDILTTLARRYPLAKVIIFPCEVQGKNAASQLLNALNYAHTLSTIDVLILARGGGSIEDLWPFNDEQLALAISNSRIPVVSGVGHETDFTIADFTADLRAATPTAAAEAVTPDKKNLLELIDNLKQQLYIFMKRIIHQQKLILANRLNRITSPVYLITNRQQTVDFYEHRLHQFLKQFIRSRQHNLQLLSAKLQTKNPLVTLRTSKTRINHLEQILQRAMVKKLTNLKQTFSAYITTLNAVSPLATLNRGYAIATCNNQLLFASNQVKSGDNIEVKLAQGHLVCTVTDIEE